MKTTVTEISNEIITDISLVTSDLDDNSDPDLATVTIKEILRVQRSEKFLKCLKCNSKVQGDCNPRIVSCKRCGRMRADRCKYGLTVKVEVKLSDDDELYIKFGDESLAKILHDEVLSMNEDSITEQLLFVEDITATYNINSHTVENVL